MKWESIAELNLPEFRRLTGVKKPTFIKMVELLQNAQEKKKILGGRDK